MSSRPLWNSFVAGVLAGIVMAVVAIVFLRYTDTPVPRALSQTATESVDPAPTARRALSCTADPGPVDPSLEILAADIDLPSSIRERVAQGADLLHASWREWLGDPALVPAPVRVRYLADQEQLVDLYQGPALGGASTNGFYRMRNNEAVILYSPFRRRDTLATTLHELSHLFTAWHLGSTPAWLNEGLAEHFETLDRRGAFPPSAEHIVVLRRDGPTPLDTLLTLRRSQFAEAEARRRYASAWSLIAFLAENPAGRETLSRLLRSAHAVRCDPERDVDISLAGYPGGLESLEADWRAWIQTL